MSRHPSDPPAAKPKGGIKTNGATLHASAVLVGEAALLITGASASGKSTLARNLISQGQIADIFVKLIGDDRVYATAHGRHVMIEAPDMLHGLIEARHLGLVFQSFECRARLGAVVILDDTAPRLPEPGHITICDLAFPQLRLPRHAVFNIDDALHLFRQSKAV